MKKVTGWGQSNTYKIDFEAVRLVQLSNRYPDDISVQEYLVVLTFSPRTAECEDKPTVYL